MQVRPAREVQTLVLTAVVPMIVMPVPVIMPVPMMAVMPMPPMVAVPPVVAHLYNASIHHLDQPDCCTEISGFCRSRRSHEQS